MLGSAEGTQHSEVDKINMPLSPGGTGFEFNRVRQGNGLWSVLENEMRDRTEQRKVEPPEAETGFAFLHVEMVGGCFPGQEKLEN